MKKRYQLIPLLVMLLAPVLAWGSPLTRQKVIHDKWQAGEYSYETVLLYRLQSIFAPENLPAALRELPDTAQFSATSLMREIFQLKRSGHLTQELADFIDKEVNRPASAGYFDSEKYNLRVHYSEEKYRDLAQEALQYAEYSWQIETGLGFREPLGDDGQGGDHRLDIYLSDQTANAAGFCAPETYYERTPEVDCSTYIVVNANNTALPVSIAHELNHAMQNAYDCLENSAAYENTSTYIMNFVYPCPETLLENLAAFQHSPFLAFDYFPQDTDILYPYGGFITLALIDELWGSGEGTLIPKLWEYMIQTDTNNSNFYAKAIARMAQEKGQTFADFQTFLTEWRYFVGQYAVAGHFKEAAAYQPVTLSKIINIMPEIIVESYNIEGVHNRGSSYVDLEFSPNMAGKLAVSFSAAVSRWGMQLFCYTPENQVTILPLELTEQRHGTIVIDSEQYKNCVVAVSNFGEEPVQKAITAYNYALHVGYRNNNMPPPKVHSITANLFECGRQQILRINGENFYSGLKVTIGGQLAGIVKLSSSQIELLAPVIKESGYYQLSLFDSDNQEIPIQDVLFLGNECRCDCNMTAACDSACACDPDCLLCECDIDTSCSPNCACDLECQTAGSGCNCQNSSSSAGPDLNTCFWLFCGLAGWLVWKKRKIANNVN